MLVHGHADIDSPLNLSTSKQKKEKVCDLLHFLEIYTKDWKLTDARLHIHLHMPTQKAYMRQLGPGSTPADSSVFTGLLDD